MSRYVALLSRLAVLSTLVGVFLAVASRVTAGSILELAHAMERPSSARNWTLDRLVGDLAAALLLVAATGLVVMSGLAVIATVATRRAPTLAAACSAITPRTYRRLVAAALGLGLTAPVIMDGQAFAAGAAPVAALAAAPVTAPLAAATAGCRVACRHGAGHGHGALSGLGFPDLPTASTARLRAGPPYRQVVVREGDSLWRLAETRLPPDASTAAVATLTWRLYALNRSTVGNDPDLIHPGMTLIAPEGSS